MNERKSSDLGPAPEQAAKWWETAEEHKFALDVLQLRVRREIMKFLGSEHVSRSLEEIERAFDLSERHARYHLELLEKALVVERSEVGYKLTKTGLLYLEKVENRR